MWSWPCSARRAADHSLTADPPLKSGLGAGQSDGGGGGGLQTTARPPPPLHQAACRTGTGRIAQLVIRDRRVFYNVKVCGRRGRNVLEDRVREY